MNHFNKIYPTEVTVNLPSDILERIDELAEKRDSSRTSIVRSALTAYFSLENSLLVRISKVDREMLIEQSVQAGMPLDLYVEELLKKAIQGVNNF